MKTRIYAAPVVIGLKQLCRLASPKHDICDTADPTPVDVGHDAHAWAPSLFTHCSLSGIRR